MPEVVNPTQSFHLVHTCTARIDGELYTSDVFRRASCDCQVNANLLSSLRMVSPATQHHLLKYRHRKQMKATPHRCLRVCRDNRLHPVHQADSAVALRLFCPWSAHDRRHGAPWHHRCHPCRMNVQPVWAVELLSGASEPATRPRTAHSTHRWGKQ